MLAAEALGMRLHNDILNINDMRATRSDSDTTGWSAAFCQDRLGTTPATITHTTKTGNHDCRTGNLALHDPSASLPSALLTNTVTQLQEVVTEQTTSDRLYAPALEGLRYVHYGTLCH